MKSMKEFELFRMMKMYHRSPTELLLVFYNIILLSREWYKIGNNQRN
jgi:hypothetical protein